MTGKTQQREGVCRLQGMAGGVFRSDLGGTGGMGFHLPGRGRCTLRGNERSQSAIRTALEEVIAKVEKDAVSGRRPLVKVLEVRLHN